MSRIASPADLIFDSVSRNLTALFEAWSEELKAAEEAFREHAKELNQEKAEAAAEAAREIYHHAGEAAEAASLLHYITGAINVAKSNDSASIVIPSTVQVASCHLSGPMMSALSDLVSDLGDEIESTDEVPLDKAQKSATWALAHGYVPHANDLADMIKAVDLDHPWAQRFAQLAAEQSALQKPIKAPPKLKALIAKQELGLLQEQVQNLQAFGAKNLGTLLLSANPKEVQSVLQSTLPKRSGSKTRTKMNPKQFNQMLNRLFSKETK